MAFTLFGQREQVSVATQILESPDYLARSYQWFVRREDLRHF